MSIFGMAVYIRKINERLRCKVVIFNEFMKVEVQSMLLYLESHNF